MMTTAAAATAAINPDHPNTFEDDERINVDEITSPIGSQIFEFCESELFPETLQNSEVDSSSNCCYDEQSSYPTNAIITTGMNSYTNNNANNANIANIDNNELKQAAVAPASGPSTPNVTTIATSAAAATAAACAAPGNTNLSMVMYDYPTEDQIENDISASIDFTPSPTFSAPQSQYIQNNNSNNNNNQEAFNISSINNQFSLGDMMNGPLHTAHQYGPDRWSTMGQPPYGVMPILGSSLPTSYEEECQPSAPSYLCLRSSQPHCSIMDPMMAPYMPSGAMNPSFSTENSGIFSGNGLMLGNDFSHHDLEFQGDNSGLFLPDSMPRVFNCSSELQALSSESQHLVHGGVNTTPLASEISSLEDPTLKVGKLSVEERKRKIHRYMKKRNERNFSKKIKYACRKTLADSRPRVRGRFAKNDELGEIARTSSSNHEEDADEDVSLFSNSIPDHQRKVGVKEDDMDSADIFAHISGVNSFKCNYPIQSWI